MDIIKLSSRPFAQLRWYYFTFMLEKSEEKDWVDV